MIERRYLAPNSAKEINVDSETRQTVFKKLKLSLFDYEVFDPLQESVFLLLASDCFHKFATTSEYKQWKKSQSKKTVFGFSIPDVPIPMPQPVVRALSPSRSSPTEEKEKKGENIVYVDKQMCLQVMQDINGCTNFRAFVEKESPNFLRKVDCWAEMELFRITVGDNPLGCYTLARNIYYKYVSLSLSLTLPFTHTLSLSLSLSLSLTLTLLTLSLLTYSLILSLAFLFRLYCCLCYSSFLSSFYD